MVTMIQASDIIRIQDEYFLETGKELSFKEAVERYKQGY